MLAWRHKVYCSGNGQTTAVMRMICLQQLRLYLQDLVQKQTAGPLLLHMLNGASGRLRLHAERVTKRHS
jgi:hypothetical protein